MISILVHAISSNADLNSPFSEMRRQKVAEDNLPIYQQSGCYLECIAVAHWSGDFIEIDSIGPVSGVRTGQSRILSKPFQYEINIGNDDVVWVSNYCKQTVAQPE